MLKKLTLIVAILFACTAAQACDGTCACGGAKPPTQMEQVKSAIYTVGEWGCYLGAGFYLGAKGMIVWPIGVPGMCIWLSKDQRAYNRANGILHTREKRMAWRMAR